MITLREANLPEDGDQILRIDTSFTTSTIYTAYVEGDQMGIRSTELAAPITKRFPLDDLLEPQRRWEFAAVAMVDDQIRGFVAAGYQPWNRRLIVCHLYVDGPHRRRGIGRLLVEHAQTYGVSRGALHLWVETSSLNSPGIQAYRRLGFTLCGLDTRLYDGTPAAGEAAIFLARQIGPEPGM